LQTGQSLIPSATGDMKCYKADMNICQIEYLIAQKTNEYRASAGYERPPLAFDIRLAYAARSWSAEQARRSQKNKLFGNIGHDGFPNQRIGVIQQEFGQESLQIYPAYPARENVAYSYGNPADIEGVAAGLANQWWKSPGHKKNMLGGRKHIGVGVVFDQWGRVFGTQIFD